jgi:hypothetical protein
VRVFEGLLAESRSAQLPRADLTAPRVEPSYEEEPSSAHKVRSLLIAGGIYLVVSLVIWWNVWSSHPTTTTTCGCGDNSIITWFLAWPVYAFSHHLNPFYTSAMFYPHGVNMVANGTSLAIGVVLAPITWAFGPIASMNVALTLSPVLSALAMFVLLRRWVSWMPAAFVGGLFYGFSPFILSNLTVAWLNLAMAPLPPLIVLCLDELLMRQRWRPAVAGVLLGLLVTLQFFVGSEVLVDTAIFGAIGIILVIAYAALRHPATLRQHARYAVVGLSFGAITAAVLLAYPGWFALAGPAHYGSLIYGVSLGGFGAVPKEFLVPPKPVSFGQAFGNQNFAYFGRPLSHQYFGIGVAAVLIGGFVAWRRDRRLWLFGSIAVVTVVLSLGVKAYPSPWSLFANLPFLGNIEPYRFVLITYLAVAVMLGLIVEHTYSAVNRRRFEARENPPTRLTGSRFWSRCPRWAGSATAIVVAAIALAPPAGYLAQGIPFAAQPVVLPTWFQTIPPHLTGHQVLLILPDRDGTEVAMTWQAVGGIHYSMVNEGGPLQVVKDPKGAAILDGISIPLSPLRSISNDDIIAVRRYIDDRGVTMVVVPDQPKLPIYDQIQSVSLAAALITAVTGHLPTHQANAWVWTRVNRSVPPVITSTGRVSECTMGLATHGVAAVDRATRCVLESTVSSPTSP